MRLKIACRRGFSDNCDAAKSIKNRWTSLTGTAVAIRLAYTSGMRLTSGNLAAISSLHSANDRVATFIRKETTRGNARPDDSVIFETAVATSMLQSTFGRDRERIWTEPNGLMAEGVTWPEVQETADGRRSRALTIHLPAIQAPANGRGLLGETAMSNSEENYTALTADIVSAYVANNSVQAGNVPALIESIHAAIAGLSAPPAPPVQQPAVNPKRSVHDDYIVCLEDGKKFKSLKRHLMALHGLTPEEYRAKWDLPRDYPMAAPNYAVKRSELAKKMGLGRIPKVPIKGKRGKRA